jgi:hypothetical protein
MVRLTPVRVFDIVFIIGMIIISIYIALTEGGMNNLKYFLVGAVIMFVVWCLIHAIEHYGPDLVGVFYDKKEDDDGGDS